MRLSARVVARRSLPEVLTSLAHWYRPLTFGLTVLVLVWAAAEVWTSFAGSPGVVPGADFAVYLNRTREWLSGGSFYLPHQLAGPYGVSMGDALYPPVVLYLLAPFTVLPAVGWWLVPAAILTGALVRIRPQPWAWLLLAVTVAYPRTLAAILMGNPSLWAIAFLAAGFAWTWAWPLVALKGTLTPFALLGMRRRRWWAGAIVAAVFAVPFGLMWLDFATVIGNARTTEELGIFYLLGEWPIAFAVVVAAWTRPRQAERTSDVPFALVRVPAL